MKKVTINLYDFNELAEDARQRAIQDHREFLESLPMECENEAGELERYYELNYSDAEIIEGIEANEYIYFHNGQMASCVTYTGKHEKTGITEFNFKGETYTL